MDRARDRCRSAGNADTRDKVAALVEDALAKGAEHLDQLAASPTCAAKHLVAALAHHDAVMVLGTVCRGFLKAASVAIAVGQLRLASLSQAERSG